MEHESVIQNYGRCGVIVLRVYLNFIDLLSSFFFFFHHTKTYVCMYLVFICPRFINAEIENGDIKTMIESPYPYCERCGLLGRCCIVWM